MKRLAALAAALLALVACNENGLNNLVGDPADLYPRIELDPEHVDFGSLAAGEERMQIITVTNVGEDVLFIEDVRIEGAVSFSLLDPDPLPDRLAPGDAGAFRVGFTPLGANEQLGEAIVYSDDPERPAAAVSLVGFGAVPELRIDPDPFDFGSVYVGCEDEVDLTLENVGTDDLVLSSIRLDNPSGAFHLTDPNALPLTLTPGQSTGLTVGVSALRAGSFGAAVEVLSNDPRELVVAEQAALGVHALVTTDRFEMPANPPIDILFAIDQSCSMDGHAQNLANNFTTLIQEIGAVTSNWKVGVVTQDSGCVNDVPFTNTTTNLQARFSAAVAVGDGNVANTEKLFRIVQSALGRTLPGQCNAGFLRPDALLHVVMVSDEYEQSGIAASSFASSVFAYKSSPNLVRISGIVCPDSGCPWADGSNSGYKDAIRLGAGDQLNILTSNWGQAARDLAETSIAGLGRFELTQIADPNSIVVSVDGTPWPTGWHFNPSTNEVVFETLPPVGADVDVSYGIIIDCP